MNKSLFPTFTRVASRLSVLTPRLIRVATCPFRLVARRWRPIVGVVLAIAVVFGTVTAILGYKVSCELARIKNEGDSVDVRELAGPPIPDSENGALIYQRVFKQLKPIEDDPLFNQYWGKETRDAAIANPTWWREAQQLFTKHDGSYFGLVLQAQARPKCRFKTNWEDGAGALFPYLYEVRRLGRVLCLRAILLAQEGKPVEAVDSLVAAVRLQDAIADDPSFIHQLVRYSLVAMSTEAATEIAERCRLSDEQAITIDRELARVDLRQSLTTALKGERTSTLWVFREVRRNRDFAALISSGESTAPGQRTLIWTYVKTIGSPILYADELAFLRLMRKQIGWSSLPYGGWTRSTQHFEAEVQAVPWVFVVTRIVTPVFARAALRRDDSVARINGSRIFIALHRYQQQHGTYPGSLPTLASGLKWTVPLDPFSGGQFKYRREGKGFLLYSIGTNLKDDGGLEKIQEPGDISDGDIVWRG